MSRSSGWRRAPATSRSGAGPGRGARAVADRSGRSGGRAPGGAVAGTAGAVAELLLGGLERTPGPPSGSGILRVAVERGCARPARVTSSQNSRSSLRELETTTINYALYSGRAANVLPRFNLELPTPLGYLKPEVDCQASRHADDDSVSQSPREIPAALCRTPTLDPHRGRGLGRRRGGLRGRGPVRHEA